MKKLHWVKAITVFAFLVTLFATYFLRSEVLELNKIRFSSADIRATESSKRLKESYPLRVKEYEIALKNHELKMDHYNEMLKLYQTDYDAYVKRLKDDYRPPKLPQQPNKPQSPDVSDQLSRNNIAFRKQQYSYFDSAVYMNWIACISALTLVGGLLLLIMYDAERSPLVYMGILILSFVFMIGPSFHSIMSAIIGFLEAPSAY
jgi:hypothetical protein